MTYPLVEELACEGVRVSTACRVLGFSPQAFYKWRNRPCSDRDWDDAHLVNEMLDIHHDDPEFGYRFISDELERHGHRVGENRASAVPPARDLLDNGETQGPRPPAGPARSR